MIAMDATASSKTWFRKTTSTIRKRFQKREFFFFKKKIRENFAGNVRGRPKMSIITARGHVMIRHCFLGKIISQTLVFPSRNGHSLKPNLRKGKSIFSTTEDPRTRSTKDAMIIGNA